MRTEEKRRKSSFIKFKNICKEKPDSIAGGGSGTVEKIGSKQLEHTCHYAILIRIQMYLVKSRFKFIIQVYRYEMFRTLHAHLYSLAA